MSYLEFLFWNIISSIPVDMIRIFFNFIFSSRKSQSQQKITLQFHLKNLIHLMNLNLDLNDIENNMLPQYSQNLFSLYKFSIKHVPALCYKKHLQKWCSTFLDAQVLHYWSTSKANGWMFLYISVRNFLFQRSSMILSTGNG